MPRKAGEIVRRAIVPEIVEKEERVELRRVPEPERPAKFDAGAFDGWAGLHDLLDCSD
jgi:hypothetical protein